LTLHIWSNFVLSVLLIENYLLLFTFFRFIFKIKFDRGVIHVFATLSASCLFISFVRLWLTSTPSQKNQIYKQLSHWNTIKKHLDIYNKTHVKIVILPDQTEHTSCESHAISTKNSQKFCALYYCETLTYNTLRFPGLFLKN